MLNHSVNEFEKNHKRKSNQVLYLVKSSNGKKEIENLINNFLNEKNSFHIWWMIVGTAYGNTVFYWAGILAPNRALSAGANRMGEASLAGVVGYLPALVFALVVMVAMVIVARAAFSEDL